MWEDRVTRVQMASWDEMLRGRLGKIIILHVESERTCREASWDALAHLLKSLEAFFSH
jgi:hypothetical protein